MTRRRWIADRCEGDRAFLTGSNAEHLTRVLRARAGQEFEISCEGVVRLGRIASISDTEVAFELGGEVTVAQRGNVMLLLAVFKFDRMEWAIEKATELGVASITPVVCRRTDAHLGAAAAKRVERWRRIAHEASQQARRVGSPQIAEPVKLKDALEISGGYRIVLSEAEQATSLSAVLAGRGGASNGSIVLAVGPEGGWTEDELRAFDGAGWISASLGPTILRAETAAIAAVAIATS